MTYTTTARSWRRERQRSEYAVSMSTSTLLMCTSRETCGKLTRSAVVELPQRCPTSKIDIKQSIFKNRYSYSTHPFATNPYNARCFNSEHWGKDTWFPRNVVRTLSTDVCSVPHHLPSFSTCFAPVASTSSWTRSIDLKYLTVLTCSSVPRSSTGLDPRTDGSPYQPSHPHPRQSVPKGASATPTASTNGLPHVRSPCSTPAPCAVQSRPRRPRAHQGQF